MAIRRRRIAIVGMLFVSSFALLATTPAAYEADIHDAVEQVVDLTPDHPVASTEVRLLVSAEALPADGAESKLIILATPEDEGGGIGSELRVTISWGPEEGRQTESGDESIELPLTRFCPLLSACDESVDVSVEWLNARDDGRAEVSVLVEAGVDFYSDDVPEGATVSAELEAALASAETAPTIRQSTEPETITLSAEAPFALRQVRLSLGEEAVPGSEEVTDMTAIVAVEGLENAEPAMATVWLEDGFGGPESLPVGSTMPVRCGESLDCASAYTLVLWWTGREPGEVVDVTWSLASVLRYPGRAEPPPQDALTMAVENAINTPGPDGQSLSVEASGVIERRPGDAIVDVPTEPGEGPHLIDVELRTWKVVPAGTGIGIPATGVLTLTARSQNGEPLQGPVLVSVVTHHPVVRYGPPRNHELSPESERLSISILPSLRCYDRTLVDNQEDGRCTVPFDIFVQTPSEATGPVRIEWSMSVAAFSADGLVLQDGDLAINVQDRQ